MKPILIFLLLSLFVIVLPLKYYWNSNSGGSWSTPNLWLVDKYNNETLYTATEYPGLGDDVTVNIIGTYTISYNLLFGVNTLNSLTITVSIGNTITLNYGTFYTINVNGSVVINMDNGLGVISFTGGLTQFQQGTLVISGNTTTVNSGISWFNPVQVNITKNNQMILKSGSYYRSSNSIYSKGLIINNGPLYFIPETTSIIQVSVDINTKSDVIVQAGTVHFNNVIRHEAYGVFYGYPSSYVFINSDYYISGGGFLGYVYGSITFTATSNLYISQSVSFRNLFMYFYGNVVIQPSTSFVFNTNQGTTFYEGSRITVSNTSVLTIYGSKFLYNSSNPILGNGTILMIPFSTSSLYRIEFTSTSLLNIYPTIDSNNMQIILTNDFKFFSPVSIKTSSLYIGGKVQFESNFTYVSTYSILGNNGHVTIGKNSYSLMNISNPSVVNFTFVSYGDSIFMGNVYQFTKPFILYSNSNTNIPTDLQTIFNSDLICQSPNLLQTVGISYVNTSSSVICNCTQCNFTCSGISPFKNPLEICSGNGVCVSKDICSCNTGYIGSNCETTYCYNNLSSDPNVCSGNGNCTSFNNCKCNIYYKGEQCQTPNPYCYGILSSDPNVCSGNGTCVSTDNCFCSVNYTGPKCDIPVPYCYGTIATNNNVCTGNGVCQSTNNCNCSTNYFGQKCQYTTCNGINSTDPLVCNQRGVCSKFDNCTCNSSYTGNLCQYPKCYGIGSNNAKVCSGKGVCISPDNCVCLNDYFGLSCNSTTCNGLNSTNPLVCNGNGTCFPLDTCTCNSNYSGSQCTLPVCYGLESTNPSVCSGKGTCKTPNNCQCGTGNSGTQCQSIACDGIVPTSSLVCNKRGKCIASNYCSCNSGYFGNLCQNTTRISGSNINLYNKYIILIISLLFLFK
jgi:hypothetical protein